jgi:hypothetical protein
MTKKIEALPDAVPTVESIEDKMYDRDRSELRDTQWTRENALRCAIDFHKNNGGMATANQLVDNAQIFLTFIQGETK